MDITFLYIDGCPGWRTTEERVHEALSAVGRADAVIRHQQVRSPEEAGAARFAGSPTILIDGRDPFESTGGPTGLACRLYRTPQGLAGSPTLEQLIEVLQ